MRGQGATSGLLVTHLYRVDSRNQAWLYKHGVDEPKGMLSRDAFFRDNFSFWSPLDQQFFKLLIGIAQKERISVVAPYFSQYFFAGFTFGDEESSKLPSWPASVPVSWGKALDAIHKHELSPTGQAARAIKRPRLIAAHSTQPLTVLDTAPNRR